MRLSIGDPACPAGSVVKALFRRVTYAHPPSWLRFSLSLVHVRNPPAVGNFHVISGYHTHPHLLLSMYCNTLVLFISLGGDGFD